MKNPRILPALAAALLLIFILHPSSFLHAQGPLTPPGAPAPTMKTLEQIEPRKEVNATNTPGDVSSVFKITTSGSYYLSGNITGASGKTGIVIAASDVTLDLNGFALTGVPGSSSGIAISGSSPRNIAIRNGVVRDWGSRGIHGLTVLNAVLQDLRLYLNGGDGLAVNAGSIVRNCISSNNTGTGFNIFSTGGAFPPADGGIVENCCATSNGQSGFDVQASAISNCEAYSNAADGITATFGSTITHCLVIANVGDGINADAGSTLTNCTARDNEGANGIFAGEGSTLVNCTARSNQVEYGIRADLRSSVTHCAVSANNSTAAESGGILVGAQSTVSGCTVTAQTNTDGTATGLTGAGIIAGNSSTVRECSVVGNRGDGIRIDGDSRVVGNNCDSNGFISSGTADGAGIHATGADNRIEGNNVTDNDRGIDVDSTGSLIVKNSASGSTGGAANNYTIAAGNSDAAIETPGAGFTSTNPWANFSF